MDLESWARVDRRRRRYDGGSLLDICAFLEAAGGAGELWSW